MDKCCARLKSGGKKCGNKSNTVRLGFNLCGVHAKIKYVDIFDETQVVWLNGSTVHRSLPARPPGEQFMRGWVGNDPMIGPPAIRSNVKKEKALVSGMCSICQDVISVGENIMILKCNHNYHSECLDPWICKTNTCPDCRKRI